MTPNLNCYRLGNKHIKGKLKKLRQEVLGAGPVEGALEQGELETDSGYDMTKVCEEETGQSEACRDLSAWRVRHKMSHNDRYQTIVMFRSASRDWSPGMIRSRGNHTLYS